MQKLDKSRSKAERGGEREPAAKEAIEAGIEGIGEGAGEETGENIEETMSSDLAEITHKCKKNQMGPSRKITKVIRDLILVLFSLLSL